MNVCFNNMELRYKFDYNKFVKTLFHNLKINPIYI